MKTEIDTDSAKRTASAYGALKAELDGAVAQAKAIDSDDSAFGLLCGLIIAPWFQGAEEQAGQFISDSAENCQAGSDAFGSIADGYEYFDAEMARTLAEAECD
ncbi:MAG: hypothetical protein LBI99_02040 [Propionibacteriaceae bacterium]|nr:hypothetical protein [Propionibacteriaceae bacterium]